MLGCITLELKVMRGVMLEIQNFKRISGGFDPRDLAWVGFLLKFKPTP